MRDASGKLIFKSRAEQAIEASFGRPVPELLRSLYVEGGLSQEEVAVRMGVNRGAVIRWMAKYRIPTRDRRAVPA